MTLFTKIFRLFSKPQEEEGWTLPVDGMMARPPIEIRARYMNTEDEARSKKELFILSQSATGRRILEDVKKLNVGIAYVDEGALGGDSSGMYDREQNVLFLVRTLSLEASALVTGHELRHAIQGKNGIVTNGYYDPYVASQFSVFNECDAFTCEGQIAYELKYGNPQGPENQVRYPNILHTLNKISPETLIIAGKAYKNNPYGLHTGEMMREMFFALLSTGLRDAYESDMIMNYEEAMSQGLRMRFVHHVPNEQILKKLILSGASYLNGITAEDLKKPQFSGVRTDTHQRLKKIYDYAGVPMPDIPIAHSSISAATILRMFPKTQKQGKKKGKRLHS